MFDSISWGEMLVVGILALIVLGPKDLLTTFRAAGKWVGRMQKMAREFSRAMNDAADQAGVGEISKTLKAASNPTKFGTDSLKSAAGMGPETQKLSAERQAQKEKMDKAMAEAAERRIARETGSTDGPAGDVADDPGMVDDTFAPPAPAPDVTAQAESDAAPAPDSVASEGAKST